MPNRSALRRLPPNDLGGIVRRRREEIGISKREAARRIGIAPSYLVALEQGRNPTTGRAPVPSPPILAAIARVLELGLGTLLELAGAPGLRSTHLLLYQRGDRYRPPLEAGRQLFAGQVNAWIEVVDPRDSQSGRMPKDVLFTKRQQLGEARSALLALETARKLAAHLSPRARGRRSTVASRLGVIFGASSAVLRSIDNPQTLLESEKTWEQDVATQFVAAVRVEPAANVCVYREADIEEISGRVDPLATVLSLIQSHPHIAVQEANGVLMRGPAAIETIIAGARPSGVSTETWHLLARAAGVGFAREATVS